MYITTKYDIESSKMFEKMVFAWDYFNLTREDVMMLKKNGLLKYVNGIDFPEITPCQVLVQFENYKTAKVIFFNTEEVLPKEIFNEPLLNKDLIERQRSNKIFWIEFIIPLEDSAITFNFSYEI